MKRYYIFVKALYKIFKRRWEKRLSSALQAFALCSRCAPQGAWRDPVVSFRQNNTDRPTIKKRYEPVREESPMRSGKRSSPTILLILFSLTAMLLVACGGGNKQALGKARADQQILVL